jgi:glyoxylate reductase
VEFNDVREAIEHGRNLSTAELGVFCDRIQDLRLGVLLFDGRWFLCHDLMNCLIWKSPSLAQASGFQQALFSQNPYFFRESGRIHALGSLPERLPATRRAPMAALVVVTNNVPKTQFPSLCESPLAIEWTFAEHRDALMDRSVLLSKIGGAQAIINQGELRVDEEILQAAPSLKIVANVAIGTDNLDTSAMASHGVWATNAPDAFTDSTADATLALMLDVTRRVAEGDRYLRRGRWHEEGIRPSLWEGPLLGKLTLGLVGYGKIGQAVERRAVAFGMNVIHTRKRPDGTSSYRTLDALLQEADIVSLHTPLTQSTKGLINPERLASMKPGSYLINLGRGSVVDENALINALASGHLAGAGLDVFEREPLVPADLLALPNVVLTPHLGGAARQARLEARRLAAENVARVLAGTPPLTPVNDPGPSTS